MIHTRWRVVLLSALLGSAVPAVGQVPGGATSGGALPEIEERTQPRTILNRPIELPTVQERNDEDMESTTQIPVSRFEIKANTDPATSWKGGAYLPVVRAQLDEFLTQQPAGGFWLGQITDVAEQIQARLRDAGMTLAQVFIPPQEVVDGVLTIEIMEGVIGDVTAEGNQRYSDRILERPVRNLIGKAVDKESVERGLLLLRDYPGLQVAGLYRAGANPGETNLTFKVNSEKPLEFNLVGDNYGSEFTGEARTIASLTWNNPLRQADQLQLISLKTWDPDNGNYTEGRYTIPVFRPATQLELGYIDNRFRVGRPGSELGDSLEGDTTIASLGVSNKFIRSRARNLTGSARLLSKRANSRDVSLGQVLARDKLTVLDLSMNFDFFDQRLGGFNYGIVGYAQGLADALGSLDDTPDPLDTPSSRLSGNGVLAGGDFGKFYMSYTRVQRVTENSTLVFRADAQSSSDLLVSLEQFSLGGPQSVRAYTPAEFLVDTGGFLSLEYSIAAPGFGEQQAFGSGYNWGELLRFSVYFDYAGGELNDPAFTEQRTRDISGYGIGIDFSVPGRFTSRLDIAEPRGSEIPIDDDDYQIYFSMNFSF